ncbi:dihydroorotate oxidase [Fructobacillus ficulneus]|uniref:dihydroorotate oxidase (fumarate) n=1 Tax=Fructobacillus ficulneus TaxID=157463 RepID=A0A0K8MHK9_9LACO|nr:dihydroorotate oxidase [Fructobacillus ficulneus]GAO99668.1 dihydroorotate oxidase [Fructobacillus ficulneus]
MTEINLQATLLDQTIDSPFLNASGVHCQTQEELDDLAQTKNLGALVTKSATLQVREGNPNPRYYDLPAGSINSMGLPNLGYEFYLDYVTKADKKPTILSVAALSAADAITLLKKIQASDYEGPTELNLSCPNIVGEPQLAYDFENTDKVLAEVFSFYTKPLGVKLPPYFDLVHFDKISAVLNKYPLTHVNTINSVGNGLWVDIETEQVVTKAKGGFGGVGGAMVLPTALANVRALRQRLNPSIKIMGTGGVTTGADAFAHILCGAELVSVGTQVIKEGLGAYDRLTAELKEIMAAKGYTSLSDFRGKLKEL